MISHNDLPFLDRKEIFDILKSHVKSPQDYRPEARVLGYMSKVIKKEDRELSIW